jgi:hypothetical protein
MLMAMSEDGNDGFGSVSPLCQGIGHCKRYKEVLDRLFC